jgi:2-oxoglutarate ferredoxin oxidoreductase subunit delta
MKGQIVIDRELCKGCGYCITACPKKLITFDENFNAMGNHPATPVDIVTCNGCGLCAVVCPDIAIEVWKEDGNNKK